MPKFRQEFGALVEVLWVVVDFQYKVLFFQTKWAVPLSFSVGRCAGQNFPGDVRAVAKVPVPHVLRKGSVMPSVGVGETLLMGVEPLLEQYGAPDVFSGPVWFCHGGLVNDILLQAVSAEGALLLLLATACLALVLPGMLVQELLVVGVNH